MDVKRIHNTELPFNLKPRKYIQWDNKLPSKPEGLWYGINNSWEEYCKKHFPEWLYEYNYEIILDERQIIIIDKLDILYRFTRKYHVKPGIINWKEVSKDYAGIEIINYKEMIKKEVPAWFTTWELDSGCIWNWDYINNIHKVKLSVPLSQGSSL